MISFTASQNFLSSSQKNSAILGRPCMTHLPLASLSMPAWLRRPPCMSTWKRAANSPVEKPLPTAATKLSATFFMPTLPAVQPAEGILSRASPRSSPMPRCASTCRRKSFLICLFPGYKGSRLDGLEWFDLQAEDDLPLQLDDGESPGFSKGAFAMRNRAFFLR